jgi:hypothetical protein
MKKVILQNNLGLFNFKKYNIYEDGNLPIEIVDTVKNAKYEAILDNGYTQKRIVCENNILKINKSFIKIGVLKIKINVMVQNVIVKSCICEDLIITADKEGIEVAPEIKRLYAKYYDMLNLLNQYSEKVERLTELVSKLYGINVEVSE